MKKFLQTALFCLVPMFVIVAANAQTVVDSTPIIGANYTDTTININNTALGANQEITSSSFVAGNATITNTDDNGIITINAALANPIVFNGNNTLTATTQGNVTTENVVYTQAQIPPTCTGTPGSTYTCVETIATTPPTTRTASTYTYVSPNNYYLTTYYYPTPTSTAPSSTIVQTEDVTANVGGTITASGSLVFTGLANEYTTTLTANAEATRVPYAITINGPTLTVDQATVNFVGSTSISSSNIYLGSMNAGMPSSMNFNSGNVTDNFLITANNLHLDGYSGIYNQSSGLLTIQGGDLMVGFASPTRFAKIYGNTLLNAVDVFIRGDYLSTASTLSFNNVTFGLGTTFNLDSFSTLDLTGSATFNVGTSFSTGFVNVHDATVTLNAAQTYNGADLDFSGTNTVYDPTYSGGATGYGLYINDVNSNMNVNSGTTTILGATYLQNGEISVANEAELSLSYLNYSGGVLSVNAGGTLVLAEGALLGRDMQVNGTLALDGNSQVTILNESDINFGYASSALSLSGANNNILATEGSVLYFSNGANLNVAANSVNTIINDISTNMNAANLNLESGSLLFLNNLIFENGSTISNLGTLKLAGTTNINQAVNFSSGNIALYGTDYTAAAGVVFGGANLFLDQNNTVTGGITMIGGTANVIAGSNTVGAGSTVVDGVSSIAGNMYIQSGYTLTFNDALTVSAPVFGNAGNLVLNGDTTFNQVAEFASGTVSLGDGVNLTFNTVNPSSLVSGEFWIADGAGRAISASITGPLLLRSSGAIIIGSGGTLTMNNFTAYGGTVSVESGGLFSLNGVSAIKGNTSITKATLQNGASMTIDAGATLTGDVDLLSGSSLAVNVASNTSYGSITGALTNSAGSGSSLVNLVVSPQFTLNSLQIAGSNTGNLILDSSNLLYNLEWQAGNVGTVNISKKTRPQVEAVLRARGSTPNQAATIAALIEQTSTGTVATVANNASADVQNGNIANANLNAEALDPDMSPLVMATASNINNHIMKAVSRRLNVSFRRHASSSRQKVTAMGQYSDRYHQQAYQSAYAQPQQNYGEYNQWGDYYYAQRVYEQRNIHDNGERQGRQYYVPAQAPVYEVYSEDVYGNSSGDVRYGSASVWVEGIYNKTKLEDKDIAGFDMDSKGLALGLEYDLDDVVVGVGYAYNKDSVDGVLRTTDIDSHTGFIYGGVQIDAWYLDGLFSYTSSSYDENKRPYGISISSKYKAKSYAGQVLSGYSFGAIAPEVGLKYIHTAVDDYTDGAGQRIKMKNDDTITALLGVRAAHRLFGHSNLTWRLAATYDLKQGDGSANVVLPNGVVYGLEGRSLDKLGMEVGLGFDFNSGRKYSLSLGYEGQFRKDYKNHTGLLQFKFKF